MFYLNEEISYKFLNSHPIVPNAEVICTEFHQLKHKWLLLGCYKPPQKLLIFMYKNLKIVYCRRLNMTTENTHLNDLLQMYDLITLIKEPTV